MNKLFFMEHASLEKPVLVWNALFILATETVKAARMKTSEPKAKHHFSLTSTHRKAT